MKIGLGAHDTAKCLSGYENEGGVGSAHPPGISTTLGIFC